MSFIEPVSLLACMIETRHVSSRSAPATVWWKFSNVSSILDLLYRINIELTFENFRGWLRQGTCHRVALLPLPDNNSQKSAQYSIDHIEKVQSWLLRMFKILKENDWKKARASRSCHYLIKNSQKVISILDLLFRINIELTFETFRGWFKKDTCHRVTLLPLPSTYSQKSAQYSI